MDEYYEYLMCELHEVVENFDTDNERAHEFCMVLTYGPQPIPETFFKFYTANLKISQEYLDNAVSYFMGLGKLTVVCDCEPEWQSVCDLKALHESNHFAMGEHSMFSNDVNYKSISTRIDQMKTEVFA